MKRMPGRSLRGRLTVLYALLLTLALALYGAGTSVYFLHNLKHQLDVSLDRDIETVEGLLVISTNGDLHISSEEGEASESELNRGYLLEVWSANGELLYRSDGLEGASLGNAPRLKDERRLEEPHSVTLPNGTRVRVAAHLHRIEDRTVWVRLGISEDSLWREFWAMVVVLAFGLPLTVAVIGAIGYAVAGRALRPVDVMARRAAAISAERLHERLQIENPSDELGHLGKAFNDTLTRLENSFDQLRRFTADASHELRTPLTSIRSVGEVALQSVGTVPYYRDIIGSMLEEVTRLTQLVDSLLTMSRADAGQIALQKAAVNVFTLAQETAALLDVLAEEKQQRILVRGDRSLSVFGDRLILRQALLNLMDNAVKYSPAGGSIEVEIGSNAKGVLISIQDSGPGISAEHREKVFERFYRIDKARTRSEGGTGLGLSIVQWAVSAHGGKISLAQPAGNGCRFEIQLPANPSV
ncbi:MAG: sensor histidine kinase [Acidobacteriaceae bacterium]